ncbi:MAG TPA: hypothetical protein VMX94_08115 [Armatimonadota bacterium]|nr:hypothetical protein [Armatimonadota bacterium]
MADADEEWYRMFAVPQNYNLGDHLVIATNSATEIMVLLQWIPWPDNTSTYKLNTSTTWTLENGVQGDNAAGDGHLQYLTWDLQP